MSKVPIASNRTGTLVVWIRRELRLQDHLALWSAVQDAGTILPLYIIDDEFREAAPARQRVIVDGLRDLRTALRAAGGDLFVREGNPAHLLHRLVRESGAAGVYLTRGYHPAERLRDAGLRASLESDGKLWREHKDQVLFEEREIVSKSQGTPFTVYTAYRNAWRERQEEIAPSLPRLTAVRVPPLDPGALPAVAPAHGSSFPTGGGEAAKVALHAFISRGVASYHVNRDLPGTDGTSRLSHHLASGSIGIRTLYHALRRRGGELRGLAKQGADAFLNELIWREFYYQVLANFPHVTGGAFKRDFDRLSWPHRPGHLAAWRDGLTGYPVIDAAMRQLKSEGWMHNRCRMITANFLTKDLHVDWRAGEAHFMAHLADGDVALNNGGWQWSAGTGNDAQPWFRIFNPALQSRKFDPQGTFLRRYLPELARVPTEFIHEPWRMPPALQVKTGCRIGRDYPAPIVDHAAERKRALALYGAVAAERRAAAPVRQTALAWEEAE